MIKFNGRYEELRLLGLPEIPKGYQLKFKITKNVTSTSNRKHTNVLSCNVYKSFFGIRYEWKSAFFSREERSARYCDDIMFLMENGYLSEEEFKSQKWYPAHLAAAGRYAFINYIVPDLRKKQDKKDRKARAKAEKLQEADDLTHINDFLKKGMP